ncbi:MAG: chemotaxis response regulator protein-glutamate methylesterase [Gemmatimonadetes bacterium]|nr:chemotaxis response regulator protein-glutamate methylesterase [Gemmatimonadota bacterium]
MTVSPIRVLLVDDSAVVRGAIGRMLDAAGDIKVVTTATNGRQALEALKHTVVDVVLLDVEMPEMDGITVLPLILERHPGVRVVMQSSLTQEGAAITMQALALGATDFIAKPTAKGTTGLAAMEQEVIGKVRAIGRMSPRRNGSHGSTPPTPARPAVERTRSILNVEGTRPQCLAIAASTGGPNALAEVLSHLSKDVMVPIVITQHMPPVFTGLLAQRLGRDSGRDCVEAKQGMPLVPGRVHLAPGDFHMLVATHEGAPFLRLTQTEPENHCRPAADPMLRSVASVYGAGALVAVLTGMGEDGRRGCEAIRERGGRVIAQDEATSVVWGMPGAVAQAGLADLVLPITEIAPRITAMCGGAA